MFAANQPYRSRLVRYALVVFVLLSCLRAWTGPREFSNPAQAQIPDSGMQRKLLLEETRRTNLLLSEIKQILTSHTLNVRVKGADKTGADN